jgi:hypothetical protein
MSNQGHHHLRRTISVNAKGAWVSLAACLELTLKRRSHWWNKDSNARMPSHLDIRPIGKVHYEPLISSILQCRAHDTYLAKATRSIAGRTHGDFVDDGSWVYLPFAS